MTITFNIKLTTRGHIQPTIGESQIVYDRGCEFREVHEEKRQQCSPSCRVYSPVNKEIDERKADSTDTAYRSLMMKKE